MSMRVGGELLEGCLAGWFAPKRLEAEGSRRVGRSAGWLTECVSGKDQGEMQAAVVGRFSPLCFSLSVSAALLVVL